MKLCNLRTSLRNRVGRKPWVGAITKPWRSFKFSSWTNIIRRVNCQSGKAFFLLLGFQMGGNQNLFLLIEVIDKVIIGIFLSRWQIGRSTVHARILILTSTTTPSLWALHGQCPLDIESMHPNNSEILSFRESRKKSDTTFNCKPLSFRPVEVWPPVCPAVR